jgi:hypothetical protein
LYYAIRSDGKQLAIDNAGEGGTFSFDKTGRYVAAMEYVSGIEKGVRGPLTRYAAWVVDMRSGHLVKRLEFTHRGVDTQPELEWDGRKLLVSGGSGGKQRTVFRH